jgi:hypothetical protein
MYSSAIQCIYDQKEAIGPHCFGLHYSIFRAVTHQAMTYDIKLKRLSKTDLKLHDFAVIWDCDHDTRVIDLVEILYLKGLLYPVLFIEEQKAHVTISIDFNFIETVSGWGTDGYKKIVEEIVENLPHGDAWSVSFEIFSVELYRDDSWEHDYRQPFRRVIDKSWHLGLKDFECTQSYLKK